MHDPIGILIYSMESRFLLLSTYQWCVLLHMKAVSTIPMNSLVRSTGDTGSIHRVERSVSE